MMPICVPIVAGPLNNFSKKKSWMMNRRVIQYKNLLNRWLKSLWLLSQIPTRNGFFI